MTDGYKIKRILTWVNGVRLPSAYQEVEYIQSTYGQNQRISTGYYANSNMRFVSEFMWRGSNSFDDVMYGTTDGTRRRGNPLCFLGNGTTFDFGAQYGADFGTIAARNVKHTFDYNLSRGILDGTTYTYNSGDSGNLEITLLYGNGKGSNGRLYSFKIYTGETLERDFVPCYRKSDNVIGLYDLVNNRFYTNSGSGTFSKGNDVPDMVEKQIYPDTRWKPNANTIAYYHLESDGNDSANNYNLSDLGSTTFGTKSGVSCAIFSTSTTSGLYNNSVSIPQGNNDWTANMYIYPTSYNSSEEDVFFMGTAGLNQGFLIYNINPLSISTWGSSVDSTTNVSLNTWSNIVITQSSKTYNIYINGALVKSGTMGSANLTGTNLNIGYAYGNNSAGNRFIGGISEFILESKARTEDEVTNYYNLTKSTYGL